MKEEYKKYLFSRKYPDIAIGRSVGFLYGFLFGLGFWLVTDWFAYGFFSDWALWFLIIEIFIGIVVIHGIIKNKRKTNS